MIETTNPAPLIKKGDQMYEQLSEKLTPDMVAGILKKQFQYNYKREGYILHGFILNVQKSSAARRVYLTVDTEVSQDEYDLKVQNVTGYPTEMLREKNQTGKNIL